MRRFGLLGLALLFVMACDDSEEKESCIEGAYEQCYCDSGASGTRLCSNGALGACVCSSVVPGPDACEGVQCEEHEACVNGSCELRDGRCDSNADCAGETPVCDTSAKRCVASQDGGLCGGEVCPSHKSCVDGACVLNAGACDLDGDCAGSEAPKCDTASHACVARCHGVTCESYEACAEATGTCELDDGRCAEAADCPAEKPACNASHVCVEDLATDPCNGVTCPSHEYCRDGDCVLNSGSCNGDGDCAGSTPKCDTASHACVARCHGVTCESYEACAEATGTCELKAGMCATSSDCAGSTPKCDTASHACVARCHGVTCESYEACAEATGTCEPLDGKCGGDADCPSDLPYCDALGVCVSQNQCEWRNCGTGTCTNLGGYATCNCPFGTTYQSNACVDLSESQRVDWCSIQWVTGWDSTLTPPIVTDFAVGSSQTVYAQVYVKNPAGGSLTGNGKEDASNVRAELLYTEEEVTLPLEPHRFTRVTATRNMDFSCNGDTCNNNEYMADLPTDKAARLRFVFRYSRDAGTSWNYCGPLEQATTLVATSTVDQLGTANIR